MFSIKKWIQATVLVSVHLSGLYAQPGSEEGASFNPNLPNPDLYQTDNSYIRGILKRLAREGDKCLKVRNITREKQILVISVLSGSDYANKKEVSDAMVETIPNESIDKPLPYLKKKVERVHGEILAIYIKKTIDGLLSKLGTKGKDTRPPYIFIFSHYIPCACVANVPYMCAEELANLGRVNRNRYEIIVGYRDVWSETNLNFAENLLQEGGIHTAMNISSGQVLHKRLKIEPEIYQEKFTMCLRNLTKIPEDSAGFFLNAVTKNCTSGKDLYGYMTQYTKAILDECVEKYVKGLPLELYARYCSIETLSQTMRLMLGRPTSVYEASWDNTSDDLNWKELYSNFADEMPSSFSEFSIERKQLQVLYRYCEDYIQQIENIYQRKEMVALKNEVRQKIKGTKDNQQKQARVATRDGQSREKTNREKTKTRDRST